MIAVVVITHNRRELLRQCVENVLLRTSQATSEIVIWDNGSTDGTAEYIASLTDPRVKTVVCPDNVGMNGYARGLALTSAPYLVELDDDVVDAPAGWDMLLLTAYEKLANIGFLAADLVDNPDDVASFVRHHVRPHEYVPTEINGVSLLTGPTGGGCAMTSRELADRVGGFRERPGEVFWLEDEDYIERIARIGYGCAVLRDLAVLHDGSEGENSRQKLEYWRRRHAIAERKTRVKRMLLAIPGGRRINARYRWFEPPSRDDPPTA